MKADRKGGRGQITFSDDPLGETAVEVGSGIEGQFDLAFAHAPIGMATFGLDYRLHRANRALCEMLSYSQRELLERTLTDLTHPDDRKRDGALARLLLRGEIPSYRQERRCHTGVERSALLLLRCHQLGRLLALRVVAAVRLLPVRRLAV